MENSTRSVYLVDLAPSSRIQEFLLADGVVDLTRVKVSNPLLDAAAVDRLLASGVSKTDVYACCADPDVLGDAARRVAAHQGHSSDPYARRRTNALFSVLGENPNTPLDALWELVEAAGSNLSHARRFVERSFADLLEHGTESLVFEHLGSQGWPSWLREAFRNDPGLDVALLEVLLEHPEVSKLRFEMTGRDRGSVSRAAEMLVEHPELFATWCRRVSSSAVGPVIAQTSSRSELREVLWSHEGACAAVLDVLEHRMQSQLLRDSASAMMVRVLCEAAHELMSNPAGVRVVLWLSNHSDNSSSLRRVLDAYVVDADDEALAAFHATRVAAAELLRRRGVDEVPVWRFMCETVAGFPGTTGELVELACSTAHPPQ